jgi:2-oxoglutarate ferredoxin oxidoreductase subunit beta
MNPETGKQIPRTYKLEETGYDGVVHEEQESDVKMGQALQRSNEWGSKIPLGVFYKNEHIPTYQERIISKIHNYAESPPSKQSIEDEDHRPITTIQRLLDNLRIDN